MRTVFILLIVLSGLSACGEKPNTIAPPSTALAKFDLGHNIVVARNMQKGPLSRDATVEEWETSLKSAIDDRIGRYEGENLFHLGISVDAFILAAPGVPLVLSPKSTVIISVNVWDNAKGAKINEEPEQIVVLERLSGETVIGSGLTQSREQQMENLSRNAARKIEEYLIENAAWFD
ncbi:hypothetical protein [Nereida sp. MMG025]|uniref:hypothetical protein n=1 Tax=Nereida sp. MMG025 TaxID=2909981 RepID=UPI001F1FF1B0|nr:hypothetical protein [Nereida sp. MMG025]MCF6445932.1 hypothetical protein [Nereida sp. MMG025]